MKHFKPEDWQEFRQKFPHAAAFLDRREIERELQHLRHWRDRFGMAMLSEFEQKRLAEIEAWEAEDKAIREAHA